MRRPSIANTRGTHLPQMKIRAHEHSARTPQFSVIGATVRTNEGIPSPMNETRSITVVRWLAVLPGAFIASWLVSRIVFSLMSTIGLDLSGRLSFLFPLLQMLPNGFAFTVVGVLVSPSRRLALATTLAAFYVGLSLVIHVIVPPNPGLTNYMHLAGASLGAIAGIALFKLIENQESIGNQT